MINFNEDGTFIITNCTHYAISYPIVDSNGNIFESMIIHVANDKNLCTNIIKACHICNIPYTIYTSRQDYFILNNTIIDNNFIFINLIKLFEKYLNISKYKEFEIMIKI